MPTAAAVIELLISIKRASPVRNDSARLTPSTTTISRANGLAVRPRTAAWTTRAPATSVAASRASHAVTPSGAERNKLPGATRCPKPIPGELA